MTKGEERIFSRKTRRNNWRRKCGMTELMLSSTRNISRRNLREMREIENRRSARNSKRDSSLRDRSLMKLRI